MLFWVITSAIAAAVAALLISAVRAGNARAVTGVQSDMAVYRDQLSEIDRDRARGVLSDAEAEAVRIEVSRRLLDADKRTPAPVAGGTGRIAAPAILIALLVVGGGLALYNRLGAPGYGDMPMAARIEALDDAARNRPDQLSAEAEAAAFRPPMPPQDPAYMDLIEKLRAALADRPDDVQGLELLARNEARLGNFTEARAAQERLIALKGDDASTRDRLTLLDIMVFAAGGYVSPEAEDILMQVLAQTPDSPQAMYYAGLLYAQNGRPDRAFPIWRRLLETGPADAPWVPVVRAEIADVAARAGVDYRPPETRGPTSKDIAAAEDMTAEDRQEMIRGMVAGLSDRLASDGGPPEDWARLITALAVLGETDRARAIADEASAKFAADPAALALIENARDRAGLAE
jgi:cytochrome c-type biogenesis protein CcmH